MSSQTIEWTPALTIGHPDIDRQHQKLFALAADMIANRDQLRAMHSLSALSEYVIVHFGDEEKLLAGIGYPQLEAHKRLHRDFRARLAKLYVNADGITLDQIAEEVRLLVNEWLTQHIMVADRDYARFLPE